MKKRLWTFVISLAIYLSLANRFVLSELVTGLVVASVVSLVLGNALPTKKEPARGVLKSLFLLIVYIPYFLWKMLLANLDVAWRVIQPKIPLNPGFVRVPAKANSKLGKLLIANSITLTPGTLTLDVEGKEFLIHWIDVKPTDPDTLYRKIARPFDRFAGGIFG